MDQELMQILTDHSKKLDAIERSVKKVRSYMFWTFMISIILFVLPLIGLAIVVPKVLDTLLKGYGSI